MLDSWFEDKLNERRSRQLLRILTTKQGLVDFTSNDYLGLAASNELFNAIEERIQEPELKLNGSGPVTRNTLNDWKQSSRVSFILKLRCYLIPDIPPILAYYHPSRQDKAPLSMMSWHTPV
jgi:hypothetical protein